LKRSIAGAKRDLNINQDTFISEIWLCGGGSRITGLANYIADELQIPARLWNPLDAFRSLDADLSAGDNRRSNSESVNGFSDTLAVALGLGINALTHQISLDLLPKEERARLTQSEQQKRTLTAVAAGVILLVGLGLGGLTLSRSHQAKTAALDQHIRNIRRAESNAKKTLAKDLAIADLLTPRGSPLDILRELSLRFADRTQVAWTTLNISRLDDLSQAKITFNIEAKSHQDVSKMIRIMAQSGVFTNIKSGQVTSVQRNKKPIFQAQITCNLAPDAVRRFAQSRHLDRDNMQKDEQVARSNEASPSDNLQATNDGRQSSAVDRSSSEEAPSGAINKKQHDGDRYSEIRKLRDEATTSEKEWETKEIDGQMEILEFESPETEVAEAESPETDVVDEESAETDAVEEDKGRDEVASPETDGEDER
jgi:Tfp pilus assembly protein PilN